MKGALLRARDGAGTGESVITAGLCRWLARQGLKVAPFKAQNVSRSTTSSRRVARRSAGTGHAGRRGRSRADGEIANQVLLKPGSDRRSQVVVLGHPRTEANAVSYQSMDRESFRGGAPARQPGPASRRVRRRDLQEHRQPRRRTSTCRTPTWPTWGWPRAAGLHHRGRRHGPGGVFAGCSAGRSRYHAARRPGAARSASSSTSSAALPNCWTAGSPCWGASPGAHSGVLPWAETSGSMRKTRRRSPGRPAPAAVGSAAAHFGSGACRISVVRLPRISNFTDIDALAAEPGVLIRLAREPAELADANLVVLPGSRATVADLGWLRERGLAAAIAERARAGRCSASAAGTRCWPGRSRTRWSPARVRSPARACSRPGWNSARISAWDGRWAARWAPRSPDTRSTTVSSGSPTRAASHSSMAAGPGGAVWGTSWHGTMENDEFRRVFLAAVARLAGRDFTPAPGTDFAGLREARLDVLGNLVAGHLRNRGAVRLIGDGAPSPARAAPAGLPVLPPRAREIGVKFGERKGAGDGPTWRRHRRGGQRRPSVAGVQAGAHLRPRRRRPGLEPSSPVPEADPRRGGARIVPDRGVQPGLEPADGYRQAVCGSGRGTVRALSRPPA